MGAIADGITATTRVLTICEHDIWDLSDARVMAEASTLSDHLIEWRCKNEIGYGIMEYGVGPGYYKYKEVQCSISPVSDYS
jgi:hypothetical protein